MMTMPDTTTYKTIVQLRDDTAAAYKDVHDRLTSISRAARASKYSQFESVNREAYTEARSHSTPSKTTKATN